MPGNWDAELRGVEEICSDWTGDSMKQAEPQEGGKCPSCGSGKLYRMNWASLNCSLCHTQYQRKPQGDSMPAPFDGHNGTHDDCGICDGILAKRMVDMGVEPEWEDA